MCKAISKNRIGLEKYIKEAKVNTGLQCHLRRSRRNSSRSRRD
jgi:hypothetical protein